VYEENTSSRLGFAGFVRSIVDTHRAIEK